MGFAACVLLFFNLYNYQKNKTPHNKNTDGDQLNDQTVAVNSNYYNHQQLV